MENKLEQLLNSLIEKGRVPFGESRIDEINRAEQYAGNWNRCCWGSKDAIQRRKSTRQIVSKESGLWQFVCENGMIKNEGGYRAKRRHLHGWEHDEDVYHDISYTKNDYEYYIIESALKDESELEDFLLQSIKVD